VDLIFKTIPEIPVWPQLPNRAPEEGMIVQYLQGFPGVVWARSSGHLFVNMESRDFDEEVVRFYERFLQTSETNHPEVLDYFQISREYAAGFYKFKEHLNKRATRVAGVKYVKGHVTGPITLGLGLPDQTGKPVYYSDQMRDVVVKTVALKAKWQIAHLKEYEKPVIIFIDEPTLASFGSSAMISVSGEHVISALNEVISAIHQIGGIAGVHCCGNTDWSIIFKTDVDILSFDAFDFGDSLFLYPEELTAFLRTGGTIAWGIVPTDEESVRGESAESLHFRYEGLIHRIADLGVSTEDAHAASLFTPSCGMSSVGIGSAERICKILSCLKAKRY